MNADTQCNEIASIRKFVGKTIDKIKDGASNCVEFEFSDGSELKIEAENVCRLAYYIPKE